MTNLLMEWDPYLCSYIREVRSHAYLNTGIFSTWINLDDKRVAKSSDILEVFTHPSSRWGCIYEFDIDVFKCW